MAWGLTMDVFLYDRDRNVRTVPTKMRDRKFRVLRELAEGASLHTGQLEFHCDGEFFEALKAQKGREEGDDLAEMRDHLKRPSYLGIPIVVDGEAKMVSKDT